MTADRYGDARKDAARPPKAPEDRFDEALREAVTADDETSCEDAEAGAFLERFPAAARQPQRPKTD